MIPRRDLFLRSDGVYEPSWAPVFYNPAASFNRDMAAAFVRAFSRARGGLRTVSDPLAATGVRGVRIALEAGGVGDLVLNDADPRACRIARLNVVLNRLEGVARLYCEEANQLMAGLSRSGVRAHYLDIDPYGSPAPFIERGVKFSRIGGVLAITATDLGPLTGRSPGKLLKRYQARSCKDADFRKEAGLRILVAYVVRKASELEVALKPLLAYYSDHYYRAYFEVARGSSSIDRLLGQVGYTIFCPACGYRAAASEGPERPRCPLCGSETKIIGPLWLGPLGSEEMLPPLREALEEMTWLSGRSRGLGLLSTIGEEIRIGYPYYYRIDALSRRLGINTSPKRSVIECLRSLGRRACETHLDPAGLRSDADFKEILECVRRESPR